MKRLYILLAVVFMVLTTKAQIINIPDANFKTKLLAASPSNSIALNGTVSIKIDINDNNEIEVSEALLVTGLNVSIANIYNMSGIEYFSNLRSLNCNQNHIPALDVSSLNNLKSLYCSLNLLTSLNLTGLTHLTNLECAENTLTQINFADATSIQNLSCRFNFLTSLDLNGLLSLQSLNCDYNQLTTLNLSNLVQLTNLGCQSNQFVALDLSPLVNLNFLNCSFNQLTSLDLSGLDNLTILNCSHNQISTLDLTNLTNLTLLNCEYNQIGNPFVLSEMTNLQSAYCHNNLIPSFTFTDMPSLEILDCSSNQIATLDVSILPALSLLNCHENGQLVYLNINNGINEQFLDFSNNPILLNICADEGQLTMVQNLITQYGYSNCQVSSTCNMAIADNFVNANIKIYPNPVQNSLHIESINGNVIHLITIYDIIGQEIIALPCTGSDSTVEVSNLKTGTYFIGINSDKGTAYSKFIKE